MKYRLTLVNQLCVGDVFTTSLTTKCVVIGKTQKHANAVPIIHTLSDDGLFHNYDNDYSSSIWGDPFREYLLCSWNMSTQEKTYYHHHARTRPLRNGDVVWCLADSGHYLIKGNNTSLSLNGEFSFSFPFATKLKPPYARRRFEYFPVVVASKN